MRIARFWQDAGVERPLSVGCVYDVPEAIGAALIATMAADRYVEAAPQVAPEVAARFAAPRRRQAK